MVRLVLVVREGRPERFLIVVRLVFVEPESSQILVRLVLAVPQCFPILDRLVHEQTAIARARRNLIKTNTTYFFIRRALEKFAQSLDAASNSCLVLISIRELQTTLRTTSVQKRKENLIKERTNERESIGTAKTEKMRDEKII